MRVVAIGGEPATGKTTLMRAVMRRLGTGWQVVQLSPLLSAMYLSRPRVVVLGMYRGSVFDGTDRLSMAVQPEALGWIQHVAAAGSSMGVAFEGDRLFNGSLLDVLGAESGVELTPIVLSTSRDVSAARHRTRADVQGEVFLKGRATKYARLSARPDVLTEMNETEEDRDRIADRVAALLRGGPDGTR